MHETEMYAWDYVVQFLKCKNAEAMVFLVDPYY